MRTHQVDADVGNLMSGVALEAEEGSAGPRAGLGLCARFHHARDVCERCADQTNPDALRRFIKAWFDAVAFIRTHKAEAVAAAMPDTGLSAEDESRNTTY